MNFTYENQGTHTYLVYALTENDVVDKMSWGMITNNEKIPGLASTLFTQMNATKFLKYDVSAKISVKQFFSVPVNKRRLIGVFNGIVDAMLSAEEYMIDPSTIVMDLDYIFADVSTYETVMICVPVERKEAGKVDMAAFFKNIMFSTQFDRNEDCDYVADILSFLNGAVAFSATEFKKVLENIENAPVQQVRNSNVQKKSQPQPTIQPTIQPNVQPVISPKPPVTQANQGSAVKPNPAPIEVFKPSNQPQVPPAPEKKTPEKMTWTYLMAHFSLDNLRIYNEQREAERAGQPIPQPTALQQKPVGFDVPGQVTVPGQNFAMNTSVQQTTAPQPQVAPKPQPQYSASKPQPVPQQQYVAPKPQPAPISAQTSNQSFGDTVVLCEGGAGETTVLNANSMMQCRPRLIRKKNNEVIEINKPAFRIGKERSYVDYFIGDNSAISRSHANVVERNGEYFVVDTNSTNHTFVNGQMIQSNTEIKIEDGAKIRLANEDFEFKLY